MKQVPNRLECSYCIRNISHGGSCQGKNNSKDEIGCLVFKADEKGCIRNSDFKIGITLYNEIPKVGMWAKDWTMNGVETEIRIRKIYALDWNIKKGKLLVHCNCDYYENEYHEDYIEPTKSKPDLKIIKGERE